MNKIEIIFVAFDVSLFVIFLHADLVDAIRHMTRVKYWLKIYIEYLNLQIFLSYPCGTL